MLSRDELVRRLERIADDARREANFDSGNESSYTIKAYRKKLYEVHRDLAEIARGIAK